MAAIAGKFGVAPCLKAGRSQVCWGEGGNGKRGREGGREMDGFPFRKSHLSFAPSSPFFWCVQGGSGGLGMEFPALALLNNYPLPSVACIRVEHIQSCPSALIVGGTNANESCPILISSAEAERRRARRRAMARREKERLKSRNGVL